jgi:hypothetical protein
MPLHLDAITAGVCHGYLSALPISLNHQVHGATTGSAPSSAGFAKRTVALSSGQHRTRQAPGAVGMCAVVEQRDIYRLTNSTLSLLVGAREQSRMFTRFSTVTVSPGPAD